MRLVCSAWLDRRLLRGKSIESLLCDFPCQILIKRSSYKRLQTVKSVFPQKDTHLLPNCPHSELFHVCVRNLIQSSERIQPESQHHHARYHSRNKTKDGTPWTHEVCGIDAEQFQVVGSLRCRIKTSDVLPGNGHRCFRFRKHTKVAEQSDEKQQLKWCFRPAPSIQHDLCFISGPVLLITAWPYLAVSENLLFPGDGVCKSDDNLILAEQTKNIITSLIYFYVLVWLCLWCIFYDMYPRAVD